MLQANSSHILIAYIPLLARGVYLSLSHTLQASQKWEDKPNSAQLHQTILGDSLSSVDYDTAASLVERAKPGTYGSSYSVRMDLGNLENTEDFFEIWKRLNDKTRKQLLIDDQVRDDEVGHPVIYDQLNRHQFALEAWNEYQKQLDAYQKEQPELEEWRQQGYTSPSALIEPNLPTFDPNWDRKTRPAEMGGEYEAKRPYANTLGWLKKAKHELAR